MKKLIVVSTFLLLSLLLIQACNKKQNPNKGTNDIIEASGQLKYGGPIAADGIDYYIELSSSQDTSLLLSPENLPDSLKHTDIDIPVKFSFYYTGKKQFGLNPNFMIPTIHLTHIQKR